MSLEFASSLFAIVSLAARIVKDFRDAPIAFDGLRREIKSLQVVLSKIQDEALGSEHLSSPTMDRISHRPWYSRTWVTQELMVQNNLHFTLEKPNSADGEILADQKIEIWSNLLSLEEELKKLGTEVESVNGNRRLHPCIVSKCKVTPFAGLEDLQSHIKKIHGLDREELKCSWPILVQRIKMNIDRCRRVLRTEHGEQACSIEPSEMYKEPHLKVARTYLFWNCCNCGNGRCQSCRRIKRQLSILAVNSFVAVFLMSASFLWLNQIAALERPSSAAKLIVSMAISTIPTPLIESSRSVQSSSVVAAYLLSCALYSTSTVAWFLARPQKSSKNYWYLFGVVTTNFWALLGVTPAELFLVFIPLSVSIGICAQTLCGGSMVNLLTHKVCVKGQKESGKLGLVFVRPIQHQHCRKPALGQCHEDLEKNLKG